MNHPIRSLVVPAYVMFTVGVTAVIASALWKQPVTTQAVGQVGWTVISFGFCLIVTSFLLLVRSRSPWSRDKIEDSLVGLKYAGAPMLLVGSLNSMQSSGISLPDLLGIISGALTLGWIQFYVKDQLKLMDQLDVLKLKRVHVKN